MKNILLAVAIAIGSISATAPAVSAATVTITENGVRLSDRDHRRHRRYENRRADRYETRRHFRHKRHDACRTRTVKRYVHHRLVIKKVTFCG